MEEAPDGRRVTSERRNAPTSRSISRQSDTSDKNAGKLGRFRRLVSKHRRSILEEAARTKPPEPPSYEQAILIPDAKSLEDQGRSVSGWRKVYHGLGLRHWAFIAVIAAYAFIGGAIFSGLEHRHFMDESLDTNRTLAKDRETLIQEILNKTKSSGQIESDLNDLLERYQHSKGLFPRTDIQWDLWDGVFYSYTLFTTIGYGHFVPTSHSGRVATMCYALFGIPLLLAVLTDFGKLLTRALKKVYSPVRHAVVHLWEMRHYKRMKAKGEDVCISHGETQQDMTQFDFPIPLALLMLVVWLFACAGFFQLWETEWTYFEAFYFFFISLSTIGLGDLTPQHPKYMIASFPLILIGLTLVSLVINLIQNKIDELRKKAQDMLEDQFGLDTISASECDQQDQEGGGAAQDAETQQPAATSTSASRPQLSNVALGVIQSMKLRARRRRIGTQTDESYVRDVLRSDYGFERELQVPPRTTSSTKARKKRESDLISMSSGSYFDAVSFSEPF